MTFQHKNLPRLLFIDGCKNLPRLVIIRLGRLCMMTKPNIENLEKQHFFFFDR